jgi:hypothetical protein
MRVQLDWKSTDVGQFSCLFRLRLEHAGRSGWPSALLGRATLAGHRLCFHKRSKTGRVKPTPSAPATQVIGVVFEITAA